MDIGQRWLYRHFPPALLATTSLSLTMLSSLSLGGQHRPVAASHRIIYHLYIQPYRHTHTYIDRSPYVHRLHAAGPIHFLAAPMTMLWLLRLSCRFLIRIYFPAQKKNIYLLELIFNGQLTRRRIMVTAVTILYFPYFCALIFNDVLTSKQFSTRCISAANNSSHFVLLVSLISRRNVSISHLTNKLNRKENLIIKVKAKKTEE